MSLSTVALGTAYVLKDDRCEEFLDRVDAVDEQMRESMEQLEHLKKVVQRLEKKGML